MRAAIARIRPWTLSVWHWLVEPWLLWVALAVLSLALVPMLHFRSESSIRISGTVLQVLGTLVVGFDIWQALQEFGRPNYYRRFVSWLARFPTWTARVASFSGTLRSGSARMTGNLTCWQSANDPDNIQGRLAALEANLNTLRQQSDDSSARLTRAVNAVKSDIQAERTARESGDSHLHSRLEAMRLGGLDWAAAGFVWVVVGTIVAGLSTELALWLRPC